MKKLKTFRRQASLIRIIINNELRNPGNVFFYTTVREMLAVEYECRLYLVKFVNHYNEREA